MSLKQMVIRYGLILGGALVAYGIVYRIAGLDRVPGLVWLFYLMVPIGAFLAMRAFKAVPEGILTFGRGVGIGSLVSAIGSFIYVVYVYLYNRFIDDSLLVSIREGSRRTYEAQGLSGEQLVQAMARVETFTQPGPFSVQVFIMLTVAGVIGTLALAAILRSRATPARTGVTVAAGRPAR